MWRTLKAINTDNVRHLENTLADFSKRCKLSFVVCYWIEECATRYNSIAEFPAKLPQKIVLIPLIDRMFIELFKNWV